MTTTPNVLALLKERKTELEFNTYRQNSPVAARKIEALKIIIVFVEQGRGDLLSDELNLIMQNEVQAVLATRLFVAETVENFWARDAK